MGKHTDDADLAKGSTQDGFWSSSTVANASNACKKQDLSVMKTAEDFNREQEAAKKAKAALEASTEGKKPVMTRDGTKFVCANVGCTLKNFLDEENSATACSYHTGQPVFRDIAKSWSCCSVKPVYDFDDFVKLPTCATGEHKKKYK